MRIRIENPTSRPRHCQWATLTMPVAVPDGTVGVAKAARGGAGLPLVAGARLSERIQLVHVRVDKIGAGETIDAMLDWTSITDQAVPEWAPSDWVAQSRIGIFSVGVRLGDADHVLDLSSTSLVRTCEQGKARRVHHLRGRIPGTMLVVDIWAYLYARQDVIPFEMLVTASDPMTTAVNQRVDHLELVTGEYPRMWTGRRRGVGQPEFVDGLWRTHLTGATNFGDGQSLAFFGSFLVPEPAGRPPHNVAPVADRMRRLRTLAAEYEAPLVAMAHGWDERSWGPLDPRVECPRGWTRRRLHAEVMAVGRRFQKKLGGAGDPWDSCPYGLAKFPGQTGDQQGFGCCKLAQALISCDPVFLHVAAHSVIHSLACRPGNMREEDGSVVRAADHPDLVTLDEVVHYHVSVSPDRLGKTDPALKPEHNGWQGRDNQHHQPLFEIGYYALTGSWMTRLLLETVAERLLSGLTLKPGWSTSSMGAPRAVGRTFLSMAWLEWALGDARMMERAQNRVDECVVPQWAGRNLAGKPVRVLGVEWDSRLPGGRGWRPPFEALGVVGLYLVWKMREHRPSLEIAYHVLKTVVNHGTVLIDDHWHICWGVFYETGEKEGDPLSPAAFWDPNRVQLGGGSWTVWAAAAIRLGPVIAREMGDGALAEKCERIYQDIEAVHGSPSQAEDAWRWAEWVAAGLGKEDNAGFHAEE